MLRSDLDKRKVAWNRLLSLIFVLGIMAALAVALPRIVAENENRTVEVIVDYTTVSALASTESDDTNDLLAALGRLGVTTVALSEVTVGDMMDAGIVSLLRPEELQTVSFDKAPDWFRSIVDDSARDPDGQAPVYVSWQPDKVPDWLAQALETRIRQVGSLALKADDSVFWKVDGHERNGSAGLTNPATAVKSMGLGFDPNEVAGLIEEGFRIALRPLDSPFLTPEEIVARMAVLDPFAPERSVVIFDGASVPGDPALRGVWTEVLLQASADVAWIEFAFQRGVPELIRSIAYGSIRLHSIAGPELHKLSRDRANARWLRAAKERGVRALYVRLYTETPPELIAAEPIDLVHANIEYIDDLISGLREAGFSLGKARSLSLKDWGWPALLLMFAAVGVAALWLVRCIYSPPIAIEGMGLLAFVAALTVVGPETGRQGAALVAAIALPTLATVVALGKVRLQAKHPVWAAVKALFLAASVSLLGSLLLVGLLSETQFALGLTLFRGVKLMHIVPPLLVALITLWRDPVASLRGVPERIIALLKQPITLGYVVFVAVVGVLTVLVVLRTGTDILPVSGLEHRLREFLEGTLGVRPRNKEFLLGHPVFVLTAYWTSRQALKGVWQATFAAVASVGQLSLVNTFAHIHSPVLISLQRTVYGLLLGAIIGSIVVYASHWLSDRVRLESFKGETKRPCG